jgi:RHH-type proline utilization regulon transcriptional repressor/proline dehydrogenase/delta 1-pyrroline-5-carboxylate dehydrogenase
VVGVQPFGGCGLSGTGPKAGGPLYLGRLVAPSPEVLPRGPRQAEVALTDFADWLQRKGATAEAEAARGDGKISALNHFAELLGPVGERNIYSLIPRGRILLVPTTETALCRQLAAVLATGNYAVIDAGSRWQGALDGLPASIAARISWSSNWAADGPFAGALIHGNTEQIRSAYATIASLPGPVVPVQATSDHGRDGYHLDSLLQEVSTSVNMAAAGGNASLMTIA